MEPNRAQGSPNEPAPCKSCGGAVEELRRSCGGAVEELLRMRDADGPPLGQVPPLLGIYAAVTRQDLDGHPPGGWTPKERVSREQAVRGYTTDAAFAGFQVARHRRRATPA